MKFRLETDLEFWLFFPQLGLNIHCKEIEIGFLCVILYVSWYKEKTEAEVLKEMRQMKDLYLEQNNSRKRINLYRCENAHETVTFDKDFGTTPMFIGCPICKERATSAMYNCNQILLPSHEWYRPNSFLGLSNGEIEHVKMGGLLLREIEK